MSRLRDVAAGLRPHGEELSGRWSGVRDFAADAADSWRNRGGQDTPRHASRATRRADRNARNRAPEPVPPAEGRAQEPVPGGHQLDERDLEANDTMRLSSNVELAHHLNQLTEERITQMWDTEMVPGTAHQLGPGCNDGADGGGTQRVVTGNLLRAHRYGAGSWMPGHK